MYRDKREFEREKKKKKEGKEEKEEKEARTRTSLDETTLNNLRKARMIWSPASVIKLIKLRWMSGKLPESSNEMKERDGATVHKARGAERFAPW